MISVITAFGDGVDWWKWRGANGDGTWHCPNINKNFHINLRFFSLLFQIRPLIKRQIYKDRLVLEFDL